MSICVSCVEICPSSAVVTETFRLSPRPAAPLSAAWVTPWAGPRALPVLSLREVGQQVLRGPASKEEERGEILPSPGCPVADEGSPTTISVSGCVPPTVTARGG